MPIDRWITQTSIAGVFMLICSMCIALAPRFALAEGGPKVRDRFPALASGMLGGAVLATLDKGTVLQADGLTISEADLKKAIAAEEPEMQKQLAKDLWFTLEQEAIRLIALAVNHWRENPLPLTPTPLPWGWNWCSTCACDSA